jgi:hypothetical protein
VRESRDARAFRLTMGWVALCVGLEHLALAFVLPPTVVVFSLTMGVALIVASLAAFLGG